MIKIQYKNHYRLAVAISAVIALVLILSLASAPAAYAYDTEELAFLTLINNYRTANGLPALTLSNSLTSASEWFSTDMANYDYFPYNHVSRDGRTFDQRIRDAGYGYNTWLGENIAAGFTSAQSVFDAWRDSAPHNTNMLSANFRAIGIGRAYNAGSTYGWYWTTDFGGVAEDNAPPAVTATRPPNGAMAYVNSSVMASFSKQISAGTLNSSSFTLTRNSDGAPVTGQISYSSNSLLATLRPNIALQSGASYTATLTTAITDLMGVPMTTQYQWSFTAREYIPPLLTWYNYGSAGTGLMIYEYAAGYAPFRVWYSGAGNWDWSRSRTTLSDQNNDDLAELDVFYDYGGNTAGVFVFDPVAFPDYEPQRRWVSCAGCWEFSRFKVVTAADQLGKNITEVLTMYNYGNDNTGLYTFDAGTGTAQRVWLSGAGNWDWSHSKILAAANYDGDATTELAILYDYGNANTGIYLFDPDLWLTPGYTPERVWLSGPGNLEFPRSKITVADQNNDGRGDIALLYDYGNANTALFLFDPSLWNTPGYSPGRLWYSGPGVWDWNRSNIISSADQDGNGRTELAILYNYGSNTTGLFLLDPAANPAYNPSLKWLSGSGTWDWNQTKPI